ncbi:MAG: DUF2318 domain-containing protein [Nitrospirae bacterium]|nr:DUF2318 domain-containing protein [Nitrospirota bacterium]
MRSVFYIVLISVCIIILVTSCQGKPAYEPVEVKKGYVIIDITGLKDSEPSFYSVKLNKKRIDFFLLRLGKDIESYLDACMKCYPNKKGFRADGFYLICKYCNERYPLDSLQKGIGSCYPIPLKGYLEGKLYKIDIKTLEKAEKFF